MTGRERPLHRHRGRVIGLASMLALTATGLAPAADDVVSEGAAAAEQQAANEGNVVDLGANFDANVFEQTGGNWVIRHNGGIPAGRPGDGEAGSPALARVRSVAAARLERVDRACRLDEAQRRKLDLAVEADIRRCVAEIEQVRRGYLGVTVNMRDRDGQRKWNRFQQDVQRCRRRLLTVFDENSLFAESLATVLDENQQAALAAETSARRSFRWQALVATAMLRLDDTLSLSHEQHGQIERLLLANEPPLRLDASHRQRNDQATQMLVFMQLAEVDQQALRGVVGESRWKAVQTLANQGRSMRSWIEGQGLLEPKRK